MQSKTWLGDKSYVYTHSTHNVDPNFPHFCLLFPSSLVCVMKSLKRKWREICSSLLHCCFMDKSRQSLSSFPNSMLFFKCIHGVVQQGKLFVAVFLVGSCRRVLQHCFPSSTAQGLPNAPQLQPDAMLTRHSRPQSVWEAVILMVLLSFTRRDHNKSQWKTVEGFIL